MTAQELKEAVDEFAQAITTYASYKDGVSLPIVSLRLANARAALVALYDRQREELTQETIWKELATAYTKIGSVEECAHWKELAHAYAPSVTGPTSQPGSRSGSASDATPTVASLSSQLERQRKESDAEYDELELIKQQWERDCESLSSHLERLKAEQRDIQRIAARLIERAQHFDDGSCYTRSAFAETDTSLLRRLSQSDTGAHP